MVFDSSSVYVLIALAVAINENDTLFVSSLDEIKNPYFKEFAKWMEIILSRKSLGIAVNKYKQLALFIAG